MLSDSSSISPPSDGFNSDPFILYSQALHDYTLKLWTESRRIAEEKARGKVSRKDEIQKRTAECNSNSCPNHIFTVAHPVIYRTVVLLSRRSLTDNIPLTHQSLYHHYPLAGFTASIKLVIDLSSAYLLEFCGNPSSSINRTFCIM
ncbi:hypothetical protein BJ138DRAFT_314421 [Hygrophoropsis aurantiaca]|uniref:Uncharacterized protein n=1 Tax=Hygrophoropsis aurantiaca TaxID=72124 RepID=A0ACB8ANA5_9AGAM|nr:hypothetical protein BJ138DRAFT_314421 [Hygrophoropsis aurantiaca]